MSREIASQKGLPRPYTRRPIKGSGWEAGERTTDQVDYGKLPIPYSSNYVVRDNTGLASAHDVRGTECRTEWICLVCGEDLDEDFWVVHTPADMSYGKPVVLEGGMHPKCAKMTAEFCPHITSALLADKCSIYSVRKKELRKDDRGDLTLPGWEKKKSQYMPKGIRVGRPS